jgi:ATP adenylyltransferase
MAYVGGERTHQGCVLCAIGNGDDEANHVVEQAERTYTVLNLFPYSSGHVMVVPRRHVPDITGLDADDGAALFAATQRAVGVIQEALGPDGFNIGINAGSAAGAGMADHVHLHVVPRWSGDTNFMPVLADVKVLPEHIDETARTLREVYARRATALQDRGPASSEEPAG